MQANPQISEQQKINPLLGMSVGPGEKLLQVSLLTFCLKPMLTCWFWARSLGVSSVCSHGMDEGVQSSLCTDSWRPILSISPRTRQATHAEEQPPKNGQHIASMALLPTAQHPSSCRARMDPAPYILLLKAKFCPRMAVIPSSPVLLILASMYSPVQGSM